MKRLRLFKQRCIASFLGRFAEVEFLRALERDHRQVLQEEARLTGEAKEQARNAASALLEAKRALDVMTEARLNADRAVEVLRGQLNELRLASEREVGGLKQVIDWLSIEMRDRQIFGTAPEKPEQQNKVEQAQQTTAPLTRGGMSRLMAEEFEREAQRIYNERGDVPLPENGPEFSSTAARQVGSRLGHDAH
jgi:hypothetical protein